MPISSIFQGNYQSTGATSVPSEGVTVINSYVDETDVRTNHAIPNLIFSSNLKGFEALVVVGVEANSSLSETFILTGTFDATNWSLAQVSVNNVNGTANIIFDITNAGQVRCTTTSTAGFVKRTIAWNVRAL